MPGLSPRERILRTLSFQESDLVPYHLMIDEDVRLRLVDYYADAEFEQRIINHLPFINLEPKIEWITDSTYIDSFGSTWKAGVFPHLDKYPLVEPELKGFQFPDLTIADNFGGVAEFLEQYNQHYRLCGIAYGLFDRGWALRGFENFLMDFVINPQFVEELFETLTEIYISLIDCIAAYPFDGIRFGDDWGFQRGIIIGSKHWRKFVKPAMTKIVGHARSKNLSVMIHSDGDVTELIPDLIEMGVQILNPVQPEVMDIVEIKRRYGRHLCLNGGVSSQLTLPRGTAEQVRAEVEACIRLLGKEGGYILSPAKSIMSDVPLENAVTLIDRMVNQPALTRQKLDSDELVQAETLKRVYSEFHTKLV